MTKLKYPKSVAAVRADQKSQWMIGDALLAECGPPSEQGVQDGSFERLDEAAREIAEQCGDEKTYDIKSLSKLRSVSYNFPESARRALSWSIHEEAGHPQALNKIIKAASKGQPITRDYMRQIIQKWKQKQKDKDPPRNRTKPGSRNKQFPGLDLMGRVNNFQNLAGESQIAAEKAEKEITPVLDKLSDIDIDVCVEEAVSTLNAWKKVVDLVRNRQGNRKGHLQVVK